MGKKNHLSQLMGKKRLDSSPCIGICSTTYGDTICRGCGRTAEEVRDWNTYSIDRRRMINVRIMKSVEDQSND